VILISERRRDTWGEPIVAPFSGVYEDGDPAFAPDGRTLYFSSKRPLTSGGQPLQRFDTWMVRYSPARGWGEPVHLGAGANSDADELYPSIDRHGNLYFGSNRDNQQWDVWRSSRLPNGRFGPAVKLGSGVNTADYWEYNPEISPDGKTLLFASLSRPGGYGWGDVYRSDVRHGAFLPAQNLGPCVNSAADDYHPTMLWEENRLIWVRNFIEDPDWYPDFFITKFRLDD
jgi:Tol biopolymer transport system component